MDKNTNLNSLTFKIVFSNRVIEINYKISSKDNQIQKIESLIKEVLNHITPKPLHKTSKDYILFCYCGKQLPHQKLLSEPICSHESQEEQSLIINKNRSYLLIEKEDEDMAKIISKENKEVEISKIFKKIKENQNILSNKKNIMLLLNVIKSRIREYMRQKERGDKILAKSFEVYYNEEYYNDLIEIGFDKNKIKAALRYSKNDKERAVFICINSCFCWDDKQYLSFDNKEVLTDKDFKKVCLEEILKILPCLKGKEELDNLFIHLIEEIKINKDDNN